MIPLPPGWFMWSEDPDALNWDAPDTDNSLRLDIANGGPSSNAKASGRSRSQDTREGGYRLDADWSPQRRRRGA